MHRVCKELVVYGTRVTMDSWFCVRSRDDGRQNELFWVPERRRQFISVMFVMQQETRKGTIMRRNAIQDVSRRTLANGRWVSFFCLSSSSQASFVVGHPTTTQRKRNGTRRRDDKLVTIVAGRWRRERFVRSDRPPVRYDSVARCVAVFLCGRRSFFTGTAVDCLILSSVYTRFMRAPTVRYSATAHCGSYALSPVTSWSSFVYTTIIFVHFCYYSIYHWHHMFNLARRRKTDQFGFVIGA